MFQSQFSQFFPPKPLFTEADVGLQHSKVAKVLYRKGGRVYIAGRSEEKAREALASEASVDAFKTKESRLDILWSNANVSQPPLSSVSKQGIKLQLANCLGPFLFTQLLLSLLEITAAACASTSPGSVRVVWSSSQMMELSAPGGAIVMSEPRHPPKDDATQNYVNSKTGNYLLSAELARQQRQSHLAAPVLSFTSNPGAATTRLFRHKSWLNYLAGPLLYDARLAALKQLYADLSADIGVEQSGCFVDLLEAAKMEKNCGKGKKVREIWEFCEEMTKGYC
ncbi:hypothetical protein N657DRAFT_656446 [Parathielavia appendiculata]|uniref:NAD(P)-binding protein n=1 Tax=Parathielavia appendiculata TaxID=2587402 RepID=A0AAN6Z2R4_9PEZI|nr:hypothetical protein N657DRAFT_656446 [Parathielavia appendiculata]